MTAALAEAQARFFAAVTGEPGRAAEEVRGLLADLPGLPAAGGARVYAEMYAARLEEALAADFPALAAAAGPEAFGALARRYAAAFPPDDPDLGRFGRHLPRFLASGAPPGLRADAADLAALEWARSESFLAADVLPAGAGALAAAGEGFPRARLELVPALRALRLDHDPRAVLEAALAGAAVPPPAPGPVHLAIWRRGFEVVHAALDRDEAAALAAARAGATLGEVCGAFAARADAEAAAVRALRSWADEGWIAAVRA